MKKQKCQIIQIDRLRGKKVAEIVEIKS